MKILIITEGFFPGKKYGGPPVSVDNFCSLMSEDDCYVVTTNHDLGETEPYKNLNDGWNIRSNCKVKYLPESEYNKNTFESIVKDICPDVIYLQSLFQRCVASMLGIAKKSGIRVVLAPRGELCKGAFRKKYKKLPYIFLLRVFGLLKGVKFQSTSDEEAEAIRKYLKAESKNVCYLTNIPSVPSKSYSSPEKISGTANFVFLSRIHPKKNLLGAIDYLQNAVGNVQLDIYGPIEDNAYWNECRAQIEKMPGNVKVEYCGLVSHDAVHDVFSRYDAFLFPTFSENYGHVIAESLIVGCPVIISDQTPWNDVNENGAGWAIPLGDKKRFADAINTIITLDDDSYRKNAREYILEKMDIEGLKASYSNVFSE